MILTPLLCTFIVYKSDNDSTDLLSVSWSTLRLTDKILGYHVKQQGY